MDCKEFRELVDLYMDRELSPEAAVAAREHVADCVACSRVEQQLQQMRNTVKRVVNQDQPPPALLQRVSQSRSAPGTLSDVPFWRKRVRIPMPAFAMILLAVVTIVGWALLRRPQTPTLQTPQVGISQKPVPSLTSDEFDLNRFDHGERAAIYKVRVSDSGNERQ